MPVPEGPDKTMGRSFDGEDWAVGAIVNGSVMVVETERENARGWGAAFENELIDTVGCTIEGTFGRMRDFKLVRVATLVLRSTIDFCSCKFG